MENRQIFAPEILSSGDFGNRYSFFENDLVCVERWIPKSNYEIPFFITTDGNFTAPTTHGEFADGFPDFISLDSGNLVNLKNVSRSETGEYGGKVYFRGDKHTSVNKLNSVVLTELMEAANKRPDDQRFIIGTCNSKAGLYPTKDIFFRYVGPQKELSCAAFISCWRILCGCSYHASLPRSIPLSLPGHSKPPHKCIQGSWV
ncbi:hypothetical protein ACFQY3_16890 [Paenibacillus farraposensis]|uniref:hypothetical protein n=1 Tax=Paenibacillus farraposensis TaxID=2807095 RepID=UPI0036108C6E